MNLSHKILGAVALSLLPLTLQAQSEYQAFRLASPYEPIGSARSAALSGAMGAVGVDVSSLVRNPAGISLFRGSNRLALTLSGDSRTNSASWYGAAASTTDKFRVRFDELAYQIGTNRLGRGKLSFAFAIRNAGRYDRTINASASLVGESGISSLADYAAARTNNARYDLGHETRFDERFSSAYLGNADRAINDPNLPYMTVLGAGADWIAALPGNRRFGSALPTAQLSATSFFLRERGSITDYDLALGVELNDAVHLGFVGTLSSLDYEQSSHYVEQYAGRSYLRLQGARSVTGFGGKIGAGILYEPIDGLRLGASVYTPTFYTTRESFTANFQGMPAILQSPSEANFDYAREERYRLRGAWRLGLSGAYVLGHHGFLSVDYDYATTGHLRLSDTPTYDSFGNEVSDDSGFEEDNSRLRTNYQGIHTLRLGAEILLSPRVALRGGYRYSSSPLKNSALKKELPDTEVLVPGTSPHYSLPNALHSYSAGLGWRITPSVSLDVAYVYARQTGRTFAFPYINDYGTSLNPTSNTTDALTPVLPEARNGLKPINETNTNHQAVATVSFRF